MRVKQSRYKWGGRFEEMAVYAYPFRGYMLAAIVVFWILLSLMSIMTSAGLIFAAVPLVYTTLFVFFQYSFVIIEYTSRGLQDVPRLSGDLFRPTTDSRLLKMLVLTSVFVSLISIVQVGFPVVAGLILLYLFPIALSVLIVQKELLPALNPLMWWRTLVALKFDRLVIEFTCIQLVLIFAAVMTLRSFAHLEDLAFLKWVVHETFLFASLVLVVIYFRFLGVLLHKNATELGIPILLSEEISNAAQEEEARGLRSEFLQTVYQEVQANRLKKAWDWLEDRMKSEKYLHEFEYWQSVSRWDKEVFTAKMAQGYIERLVSRKEYRDAFEVFDTAIQAKDDFRFLSGDTALLLVSLADTTDRKRNLVKILTRFPEDYPQHPKKGEALLTGAQLSATDLNDFEGAREILHLMETTCPDMLNHAKYGSLNAILTE